MLEVAIIRWVNCAYGQLQYSERRQHVCQEYNPYTITELTLNSVASDSCYLLTRLEPNAIFRSALGTHLPQGSTCEFCNAFQFTVDEMSGYVSFHSPSSQLKPAWSLSSDFS